MNDDNKKILNDALDVVLKKIQRLCTKDTKDCNVIKQGLKSIENDIVSLVEMLNEMKSCSITNKLNDLIINVYNDTNQLRRNLDKHYHNSSKQMVDYLVTMVADINSIKRNIGIKTNRSECTKKKSGLEIDDADLTITSSDYHGKSKCNDNIFKKSDKYKLSGSKIDPFLRSQSSINQIGSTLDSIGSKVDPLYLTTSSVNRSDNSLAMRNNKDNLVNKTRSILDSMNLEESDLNESVCTNQDLNESVCTNQDLNEAFIQYNDDQSPVVLSKSYLEKSIAPVQSHFYDSFLDNSPSEAQLPSILSLTPTDTSPPKRRKPPRYSFSPVEMTMNQYDLNMSPSRKSISQIGSTLDRISLNVDPFCRSKSTVSEIGSTLDRIGSSIDPFTKLTCSSSQVNSCLKSKSFNSTGSTLGRIGSSIDPFTRSTCSSSQDVTPVNSCLKSKFFDTKTSKNSIDRKNNFNDISSILGSRQNLIDTDSSIDVYNSTIPQQNDYFLPSSDSFSETKDRCNLSSIKGNGNFLMDSISFSKPQYEINKKRDGSSFDEPNRIGRKSNFNDISSIIGSKQNLMNIESSIDVFNSTIPQKNDYFLPSSDSFSETKDRCNLSSIKGSGNFLMDNKSFSKPQFEINKKRNEVSFDEPDLSENITSSPIKRNKRRLTDTSNKGNQSVSFSLDCSDCALKNKNKLYRPNLSEYSEGSTLWPNSEYSEIFETSSEYTDSFEPKSKHYDLIDLSSSSKSSVEQSEEAAIKAINSDRCGRSRDEQSEEAAIKAINSDRCERSRDEQRQSSSRRSKSAIDSKELSKSYEKGWEYAHKKYNPETEAQFSPIRQILGTLGQGLLNGLHYDMLTWIVSMSEQGYYDNSLLMLSTNYNDVEKMKLNIMANFNVYTKEYMLENWRNLRILGRGTFGIVCKVEDRKLLQLLALKYINISTDDEKFVGSMLLALKERNYLLRAQRSPYIIQMIGSFKLDEAAGTFIIMEYCLFCLAQFVYFMKHYLVIDPIYEILTKCNAPKLSHEYFRISNGLKFDVERVMAIYCFEMFAMLDHLANCNIVHCDIRLENLVVTPSFHLKLTDFGMVENRHYFTEVGNIVLLQYDNYDRREKEKFYRYLKTAQAYYDLEIAFFSIKEDKKMLAMLSKLNVDHDLYLGPILNNYMSDTWSMGICMMYTIYMGYSLLELNTIPIQCRHMFPDKLAQPVFIIHAILNDYVNHKLFGRPSLTIWGDTMGKLPQIINSIFTPRSNRCDGYTKKQKAKNFDIKSEDMAIDLDAIESIDIFQKYNLKRYNCFLYEMPKFLHEIKKYNQVSSTFYDFASYLDYIKDENYQCTKNPPVAFNLAVV